MPLLFLLFVIMPIVEMSILIAVGTRIGALSTIGLVLFTALLGSVMLRQQGLDTLFRARARIDSGEIPAHELIEGLILAVGGALLITPGFVTDFMGFLCLLPQTRHVAIAKLSQRAMFAANIHTHQRAWTQERFDHSGSSPFKQNTNSNKRNSSETLEGEFSRDDDNV